MLKLLKIIEQNRKLTSLSLAYNLLLEDQSKEPKDPPLVGEDT